MFNFAPFFHQDHTVYQMPITYSYQVSDNSESYRETNQENLQCLKTKTLWNIRDLGGHNTLDSKTTKPHMFIRSSVPRDLNKDDIKMLKDYGLSTVIDLRTKSELDKKLNSLTNVEGVKYHNIEFDLYNNIEDETKVTVSELYINSIEDKELIKKIFDAIATACDEQGTVMFHCYAGRDRTSIVAMLILGVTNVDENEIVQDYLQTFDNIRNETLYQKYIIEGGTPIPSNKESASEIKKVIDYIKDNYESYEEYLLACGVDKSSIKSIKDKLV